MEHALFSTLLHSLWLGIVLSVCTGLIILFTKKATAALRYNLLVSLLGVFLICITAIFFRELSTADSKSVDVVLSSAQQSTTAHQSDSFAKLDILSSSSSIFAFFNNYAAQIVLIWFLIICIKSIQLIIGLQSISYIKKNKVFSAGNYWEDRLKGLANRFQISRPVKLVQSGIAKVPVIVGHLKPIILIPLGMLNGLSEREIEAILAHELAHVKRQDYLVNLLQSFAEILFFFNPAVLWISALIREERENCCDDLALATTSNKNEYIHALISCEEFDSSKMAYAMAFGRKRNQLMDRVSRIAFNKSTTLNRVEKMVLILLLGTGILLASAFKASKVLATAKPVKALQVEALKKDTIIHKDTLTYKKQIIAQKKRKILELQAEIAKLKRADVSDGSEVSIDLNINKDVNSNTLVTTEISTPVAITPKIAISTTTTRSITVDGAHVEKNEFNDAIMKNIISDMLNSGIITETKKLSFKVGPKEMVVNGVKQPADIQETFRQKYLKKPDRSVLYNYDTTSSAY